MQIYVIKRGDTLWNIARTYNTTVEEIQTSNEIPDANVLVVGQTIVIPIEGQYYIVKSGDNLWAIGQKFNINYIELAKINQLDLNRYLRVGEKIYIPPTARSRAEINAYIEPSGNTVSPLLLESAREVSPILTYLAPFSYQVQRDGSLALLAIDGLPEIAKKYGTTLMLVVTNLENGQFSGELARVILESPDIQATLLENIVQEARRAGVFSDVHFDFEFIPADLREEYTKFIKDASVKMRQEGLLVSVALAPKTSSTQKGQWYEAHDYRAIGEVADFVVIMTYEWGYSAGPPLPVSPIMPVEKVLQYALTEMPSYKIMMGQNLYGYDWTLPFVKGKSFAKALSPQRAIAIAAERQVAISYDKKAQAPFFNYVDDEGKKHIVWFEDANSIQAKFDLLKRLGLRGISYWKLPFDFPQNWLLVPNNFNVVKR